MEGIVWNLSYNLNEATMNAPGNWYGREPETGETVMVE